VQNHAGTKKFEAKQLKEDSFREIVDHVWQQADAANLAGGIHAKLNHLHTSMHAWDHEILRKPKRLLRAAQRKLEKAVSGCKDQELMGFRMVTVTRHFFTN
jgi:hypothetical protein